MLTPARLGLGPLPATPANPAAMAARDGASGDRFAEMLSQRQDRPPHAPEAVKPAAKPPEPPMNGHRAAPVAARRDPAPSVSAPTESDDADAAEAPAGSRPQAPTRPGAPAKPRHATAGPRPHAAAKADAADANAAPASTGAADNRPAARGEGAVDASMPPWLVDLAAATSADNNPSTAEAADELALDAATTRAAGPAGTDAAAAGADPAATALRATPAHTPAEALGALAAGLAEPRPLERRDGRAGLSTDPAAAPAIGLRAAPGAAAGLPAASAVHLATPPDSPEFARALGVQVSMLAQGGVQHARIELNPAEMGPVSVQIVIEGSQARVDFGADVQATRSAIEAGLPELAGALREAGLTLTGGGVSQHSRGQAEDGDPAARAHGAGRGEPGERDEEAPLIRPRRVALGGVDLYA